MRNDIKERKKEILTWIEENQSKAFICRQLQCKPDTLEFWLKNLEINYGGNQGNIGHKESLNRKTAIEYLNSKQYVSAHRLKIKLIEDGVKHHQCEKCKLKEWNGVLIPLELHHIDGNRHNNELVNLQILCPNCHAQTDNNSGKNIGRLKRL